MLTGKPYPIKVWLERSRNKMLQNANPQSWLPAMKNVDLIVHMFMYPTSFSMYADILLPATEWLETNMLVEALNMVFARQPVAHVRRRNAFLVETHQACAALGNENCKRACDPAFMKGDLAYWDSMEELLDGRLKNIGMTWKQFLKVQPYTFMPYENGIATTSTRRKIRRRASPRGSARLRRNWNSTERSLLNWVAPANRMLWTRCRR